MMGNVNQIKYFFEELIAKNVEPTKISKKLYSLIQKNMEAIFLSSKNYVNFMTLDHERTLFYQKIIKLNCQNKKILEIGSGLGISSLMIAREKPASLTICEAYEPNAIITKNLLNSNSFYEFELINKPSFMISEDEFPEFGFDLIISELFSSNAFGEGVLEILKNARRFLAHNGRIIPGLLEIFYIPVQYQTTETEIKKIEKIIPGINMKAWDSDLIQPIFKMPFCIISPPQILFSIDFNSDFSMEDEKSIKLPKKSNGLVLFFRVIESGYSMATFNDGSSDYYPSSWGIPKYFFRRRLKSMSPTIETY